MAAVKAFARNTLELIGFMVDFGLTAVLCCPPQQYSGFSPTFCHMGGDSPKHVTANDIAAAGFRRFRKLVISIGTVEAAAV